MCCLGIRWVCVLPGLLVGLVLLPGCPGRWATGASLARQASERPAAHPAEPGPDADLTAQAYPWLSQDSPYEALVQRFPTPAGFRRVVLADASWGQWLRNLPVREPGSPVLSRSGEIIVPARSRHLAAVVDMDVRKDQECADTIWRLRAEYLWWQQQADKFTVPLSDGQQMSWTEWREGVRPRLRGDRLQFARTARPDSSRAGFNGFLDSVFAWCGTYSLAQQRVPLVDGAPRVGDLFIHGGSPGHAVLLVDIARDAAGKTKALLLQGFMPAQSAHVVAPGGGETWFDLVPGEPVDTPFWGAFSWSELGRLG